MVYAKPPFGGPEHVLRYLGRYTHRVAISNHRLASFADGKVTFRWRDSAHGNEQKLMTLSLDEFLRRFLLHLLPEGFVRIRNFGFLANRHRATNLPLCFQLLGGASQAEQEASTAGYGCGMKRRSPIRKRVSTRSVPLRLAAERISISNFFDPALHDPFSQQPTSGSYSHVSRSAAQPRRSSALLLPTIEFA